MSWLHAGGFMGRNEPVSEQMTCKDGQFGKYCYIPISVNWGKKIDIRFCFQQLHGQDTAGLSPAILADLTQIFEG